MITEYVTEFNGNESYITQHLPLPLYYGSDHVGFFYTRIPIWR